MAGQANSYDDSDYPMASVSPAIIEQSELGYVMGLFDINAISGDSEFSTLQDETVVPVTTTPAGPDFESILDGYDRILEKRLQELRGSRL